MYSWAALSSSKSRSKQPSPEHLQGRADSHVSRAIESEGCFLRMQLALHAKLWQQKEAGRAATPSAACAGANTACMPPFFALRRGCEVAGQDCLVGQISKQAGSEHFTQKLTTMSSLAFSTRLSTPYSVPLYRSRLPAWHRECSYHAGQLHSAAAWQPLLLPLACTGAACRRARQGERQQRHALMTSCHTPT